MSAVFVGFVAYLLVVVVAGALTYRMTRDQADFLLAGRRLNVWVATLSERASSESAWLLLGLPGAAFISGLVESWAVLGCLSGIILSWWFVAGALRRETEKYDALTLPEFFAKRFGDYAAPIRLLASLIILFFYAFYVAAQFRGAGTVLNVTFGIDADTGMILGAAIIIAYTMAGGFFAVAWTDVIQAILMLGTLVILPAVALVAISAGDGPGLSAALAAHGDSASWTGSKTGLAAVGAVVGGLSWGFGYFGQPHTLVRYMAIGDASQIPKARWIAVIWGLLAFSGAMMIGLAGLALFGDHPDLAAGFRANGDTVMPTLATELLPAWLAGIFVSGAVAAMMSTADSQLLVGTSAVAEDLCHKTFGIELSPKRLLLLSRVVAIGLGMAALILAFVSDDFIFGLVSYAWGGLGASFGPAILLTLYWKRLTGRGVAASMAAGTLATVVWKNIDVLENALSARAAAFSIATAVAVTVSLVERRRSEA